MAAKFEAQGFGPVGMCIYCHATESLSKEHIMPLSLGGSTTLLEASCEECRQATRSTEGHVAQQMLGNLRMAGNLRSRRRKNWPDTLPLIIETEAGPREIPVPRAAHPGVGVLLRMPPPRLFLPGTPSLDEAVEMSATFLHRNIELQSFRDLLPGQPQVELSGSITFNVVPFYRFLAKVAHAFATWFLGVDGFVPVLPDIIRDSPTQVPMFHVIGCDPSSDPPNQKHVHEMCVQRRATIRGEVVVVRIRLFAEMTCHDGLGSPAYAIIAGQPNDATQERFRSGPFYPKANRYRKNRTPSGKE